MMEGKEEEEDSDRGQRKGNGQLLNSNQPSVHTLDAMNTSE